MATTNTKTDPRHYLNYLNGEDGSEESSIEDMSRDIGHGGDCEAISYEMISDIEMSGVDASGIDAVADVDESFFAEKDDGGSRGLLDDVSLGSHHGSLGHAGHASSASSHSGSILAPPPGNGHESLVDLDSIEGTDGDSEAEQEALQDDDDEEEVEDYENIYENVYEPQDERRTYLNLNLNPNPNTNTNTNTNPNLANAQTLSVVQRLLPNEAEEMSVSSIPRSALPRITGNGNGNGNGTGSVPSMLSSKTHPEQEAQRETSGSLVSLLDPPDATDYAPADCFTPGVSILPKSNVNAIANANRSNSNSNADERRKNRSKNNRTNGNWRVAEMTSRTAGRDTDRASTSRSSNTNTNTNTNQVLNNKPSKSGATRKQETAEQKQQREQQERVVAANTMAARELPPPPQQRPNGDAANANANANANADANSDVDADANANANANADTSYHNNYSHLLSAYEFEHDPSIPPLPPPVVELVQSPTDERYCSTTGNNQSPNTSYESDIELGRNEDDQGVQGKTKTPRGTDPSADPSTSKKKKTLLSVFSPTYFRPNDDNDNADADADKDENKEGNTPETDTNLSPSNTFEEGSIARGRKLFSPEEPGATRSNNNAHRSSDRSFDDLYYDDESGHKTGESASHRDGDSSKAVSKQNQRKRKGNPRCLWIWIIVFSVLVIGAATGVIAYSMIKKSRAMNAEAELEASSANDVAIDGIANVANVAIDGGDQSESESQSENTNLGANTPDDPQSQEVLVVLPPVPPPTLRPVTLKDPTGAPSEYPTVAPTFPRPTMFPTSTPTVSPTISPTVAKSATDQLTERLEGLLQSRNYANGGGGVGDETQEQAQLPQEPFSFDFSAQNIASGGMNDPAHKALLYMAREAEATHGLSLSLANANANANSNNSKDSFVPIDLASYDNPKLMQRFALLAVRFGATLSSGNAVAEAQTQTQVPTEFATAWIANSPGLAVALPAKRIVVSGGEAGENAGDLEGGEVQPTVGSATAAAVANANSNANVAGGSDTSSAIGMVTAPTTDGAPTQANPLPSSLADPDDPMFLVDECYWEGVVCEAENETENSNSTATTTPRIPAVVSLKWGYLTLSGTISPAVGLLSGLTSLDLSHNELVGSIPESLFDLTSLRELYLYHNNLTGTLSTRIGDLDALERLHLSHNALSGSLPTELKSDAGSVGGIRPLRYFNVYSNKFTGTIPSDLRWRQCIHFDVGRNQLTGTLPEDIGEKFVDLRHLYLDHNAFIGTLPSSYNTVGNGRLKALAIDHNRLTGEVPGARDHYDNLVQYTLHENLFRSLDQRNCQNHLLVEFKADCNANVCTCFGGFEFCERWCGYESGGRGPNNPARNPTFDSNPNLNWQQQQQRPPWQRPPQDWSF